MAEFVEVGNEAELEESKGKVVEVKGKKIAIFKVNGKFTAIDNTCPHKGGPLGEGSLEGEIVSCPWHGWKFNVETGVSPVVPTVKVAKYETRVENGKVFVAVD